MLEIAQREREKQWKSEMRRMVLTNEAAASTDHRYQEKRAVEHLRGQLATVKGSGMSLAETSNLDLEQETEIQAYRLEVNEKEMRAQQFQYVARVMAEATKTLEDAAVNIQSQAKDEHRQIREANLAPTEANKILRRENLLGTSAIDGRERIVLDEKFQELEDSKRTTKSLKRNYQK